MAEIYEYRGVCDLVYAEVTVMTTAAKLIMVM